MSPYYFTSWWFDFGSVSGDSDSPRYEYLFRIPAEVLVDGGILPGPSGRSGYSKEQVKDICTQVLLGRSVRKMEEDTQVNDKCGAYGAAMGVMVVVLFLLVILALITVGIVER